MKWPWEGIFTVVVQVSRQTSEGSWVPVGAVHVKDNGSTHSDPGVGEWIVNEVLLSLYRGNVAFGTGSMDGVSYRWEETSTQEKERYKYQ